MSFLKLSSPVSFACGLVAWPTNRCTKQIVRVARGSTGLSLILPDSETCSIIKPPADSQSILTDLFQQGDDQNATGVSPRPAVCSDGKYVYILVYNRTANTTTIIKVGSGHCGTLAGKVYKSTKVESLALQFMY